MANLSQTAANVAIGSSSTRVRVVQAGESITQGMPVYRLSSDSKFYQSDANASAAASDCDGIAITPAATDGYFVIVEPGVGAKVNLGATLTVGQTYTVSATKGAICPIADLTTGDYPTILGVASTTALLDFIVNASGVVKP
jgi:hypothetical protein